MMNTLITLAASIALAGQTVQMNGKTISTNVKLVSGKPYVALSDVARALGMQVVRVGGGYKLVASGGANQVRAKTSGDIGDELFTGDWRFKVISAREADQYAHRFGDADTISPKQPGEKLVVVTCRLKNGHSKVEELNFTNDFGTNSHSALTDSDEHSYPIVDYDVHYTHFKWAASVLPGAAIDFALVFSVPQSAVPKSLVYSIYRYDDRGNSAKTTDVRVRLSK